MSGASIDGSAFRSAFDRFRALVEARSGHRFRSFDEGLAAIWENYKPRLRDHALGLLNSGDSSEGEAEVRGDGFRHVAVRPTGEPGVRASPCCMVGWFIRSNPRLVRRSLGFTESEVLSYGQSSVQDR